MKTIRFFEKDLSKAAEFIQHGEIIAFPTDTVYGLGADATNEEAVKKIFKAKGRPANRPLNVLIADKKDITQYAVDVPEEALLLAEKFWPGPLTIILNKKNMFAPSVTGELNTIGLRMPDHPLTLKFIKQCGVPLAAPSANSSGRPSPTTADHVFDDLEGKIPGVIDGGETPFGIESTVLELSNPAHPIILRPGGITKNAIEEAIGHKVYPLESNQQHPEKSNVQSTSKHYEPTIPVYIVQSEWRDAIEKMSRKEEKIGLLANEDVLSEYRNEVTATFSLGKPQDIDSANQNFFNGLRSLEHSSATVILVEAFENGELSEAYMDRAKNAANGKKI